jgi:DNA-binding IclR family transcriptional regulator
MKYREGLTPDELARHDKLQAQYEAHKADAKALKPEITAIRMRGYQRVHRQEKDNVATD